MPKAIKKRVTKKTTNTEVEVKEKLSGLKDTLKERQRTALITGAAIVVVIIAVVGFFIYSSNTEKRAKALEYEGYKIYGSVQIQTANKEEQYKKALDLFKKAYDTSKSPFSLYYIAACDYEIGNYDDALKALKDFVQRYSGDEKFLPLAHQKMVLVYMKKGDLGEAKKSLDTLYALNGEIYKDFALMEYGKLLEKEGKADEAKKKYEELVKKFPNSPFADEAKSKIAEKKG